LDVGCGSGCIGISLLASAAEAANIDIEECVAIDMSADAVALSNRNADNLLLPSIRNKYSVSHVSWREFAQNSSNWGKFDLIVSNPPYITKEEAEVLQREVADFESPLALLGGTDGMVMIRDLLLLAPVLYRRDLGTTKALWLETGESHPELITSAMTNAQVETMTGGGSDNKLWDKLLNSSSDPLQNLPISKESIFERYVNRYVTSSATPIRDLSGRMRFFSVNIV
jgi:HemK-like putative methylase